MKNNLTNKIFFLIPSNKKREIFVLSLLMLIGVVLEMVGLGIIIPGFSIILNPSIINSNVGIKKILHYIGNPDDSSLTMIILGFFVFIYLVKFLFFIFLTWKQNSFSNSINLSLSQELFEGYLSLPYTFHLNRNSSELLRIIQGDVGAFVSMMQSTIIITIELTMLLGVSLVLLIAEPLGTILIISFLFISGMLFQRTLKNKLLFFGKKKQYFGGLIYQSLLQGFGAVKDVKLLGRENYFENEFQKNNTVYISNLSKINVFNALPRPYLEFISIIGLSFMIIVLKLKGENISLLVPTLGVFLAAAFRMIPSINRIMSSIQAIRVSSPSIDTLCNEIKNIRSSKQKSRINSVEIEFKQKIKVIDLSYKYPNANNLALSKINFEIEFGESIGIVGPSGSGKSTLIDLILGLLIPTSGQIIVEAQDINQNLRQWQNQIGYVPQNIFLTDDSIKKNIAFGIPENVIDTVALNNAIKAAQLDEFVNSLPEGINAYVGERGVRLSGGQRQRIGIARALYHNPNVLVFDEATSALDSNTESNFMAAVDQLKGHKTLIIIAHRISTLENCDKILTINNGTLYITKKQIK